MSENENATRLGGDLNSSEQLQTSSTGSRSQQLLSWAQHYASIGWKVFPLGDESKKPITEHGYLDGTTDPATIAAWWTAHPDARIGHALRPSGVIAIDVDPRNGGDVTIAALEAKYGPLPRNYNQQSGGGGEHIIMRDPSPGDDGWTRVQTDGGACRGNLDHAGCGSGVDFKCNGYIVLAPSGNYRWLAADLQTLNIPAVPEAWIPLLRKPDAEIVIGEGLDAWQASIATLTQEQTARLRSCLTNIVRGKDPSGTTFHAVATIFHDFGLSIDDGTPYLLTWNASNQDQHTNAELARQIGRVSAKVAADGHGGVRGHALERHGDELLLALYPEGMPASPPNEAPARDGVRASSVIDEIVEKSNLPVVWTPWSNLNEVTGGLELGSITLPVGYQGSGKSSMSAELAAFHAKSAPVVYYLGEMGARVLVARIVGQLMKCSWRDVLRGKVSREDMHRVLDPLHLFVVSTRTDPIKAIIRELSRIKEDCIPGTPLLVIDYVQLLAAGKDIRQEMVEAVRSIQQITEERSLVTWVLSQTARSNSARMREGAEDSIDLADTGAETAELERSATNVLVLSYQQKDDTRVHEVTVAVAKRRFGGPTKCYFNFDGETGLFLPRNDTIVLHGNAELEEQILLHVDVHAERKCRGGMICGYELTTEALYKTTSCHKVGSQPKVVAAVKKLVDRKVLYRDGLTLRRAPMPGGSV